MYNGVIVSLIASKRERDETTSFVRGRPGSIWTPRTTSVEGSDDDWENSQHTTSAGSKRSALPLPHLPQTAIQTAMELENSWLTTAEVGALVNLLCEKQAHVDSYLALEKNEDVRHSISSAIIPIAFVLPHVVGIVEYIEFKCLHLLTLTVWVCIIVLVAGRVVVNVVWVVGKDELCSAHMAGGTWACMLIENCGGRNAKDPFDHVSCGHMTKVVQFLRIFWPMINCQPVNFPKRIRPVGRARSPSLGGTRGARARTLSCPGPIQDGVLRDLNRLRSWKKKGRFIAKNSFSSMVRVSGKDGSSGSGVLEHKSLRSLFSGELEHRSSRPLMWVLLARCKTRTQQQPTTHNNKHSNSLGGYGDYTRTQQQDASVKGERRRPLLQLQAYQHFNTTLDLVLVQID
ncbi:hypothetical protein FA13DRAFT_1722925 [Coprinellus micaceus]|uniref:Uncharacterized protein n=1 Tax=Coprinellus micaceus TaxID=71717 RepID=A0A4Y7RBL7_COPMI|nr:hypothetical protein FA13DRAFT_1722925 [Coprinellus micaceus]